MLAVMLTGIVVVLIVMTLSIYEMWRRIVILELKASEPPQHQADAASTGEATS